MKQTNSSFSLSHKHPETNIKTHSGKAHRSAIKVSARTHTSRSCPERDPRLKSECTKCALLWTIGSQAQHTGVVVTETCNQMLSRGAIVTLVQTPVCVCMCLCPLWCTTASNDKLCLLSGAGYIVRPLAPWIQSREILWRFIEHGTDTKGRESRAVGKQTQQHQQADRPPSQRVTVHQLPFPLPGSPSCLYNKCLFR